MSSAVHDMQVAILEGKQSLTQLLRRTKLIAASLNLADVEKWVDYELKGYPADADLPKYRTVNTEALHILNPVQGWRFAGHSCCRR